MQRPLSFAWILGVSSVVGACAGADPSDSQEPSTGAEGAEVSEAGAEAGDAGAIGAAAISKELPPELIAELRLQGDDGDGRLLTLAPGFIATAECSDCGAPSYLWFLAVRCDDGRHCEVLTEQCEGAISREGETFTLAFRPVEADADPELCAGYSGTFESP
jgi:hypothetical protein